MKFYGISAKVKPGIEPPRVADDGSSTGTDGAVLFYKGDSLMLCVQWSELPQHGGWRLLESPAPAWRGVAIGSRPIDYDPDKDRWVAPEFVEALYLRTSADTDEYVCPTLHRPKFVAPQVVGGATMTVAQLIAELQKVPQRVHDTAVVDIYVRSGDAGGAHGGKWNVAVRWDGWQQVRIEADPE